MVEVTKIKERLKILFPSVNLSKKRIDEISAKLAKKPADNAEDTDIDLIINDFNDIVSFEEISKQDDRERGLQAKLKTLTGAKPKLEDTDDDDEIIPPSDDTPEWVSKLVLTVDGLKSKLENFEAEKVKDTRRTEVLKSFKASDILKNLPENVLKKQVGLIDLDADDLDGQIESLENDFKDVFKSASDSKQYSGAPPSGEVSKGEPTQEELDEAFGKV